MIYALSSNIHLGCYIIQNDQIYFLYKCYIEKFIFIKIHIYFKYFFHYFYTKPNYIVGGKLLYMFDFWYM